MASTGKRFFVKNLLPLLLVVLVLTPLEARSAADEYSPAELEEIVGPIALYPDVVLSSILAASTAPTDVVQAARWVGAQEGEITQAPDDANWDPAVEAMIQFPDVLVWMSGNLDWMEMLAYAVAVQEDDVLQAVQDFRKKASEAGNLDSNEQIQVVQEGTVIYVQPAQPSVVYVPAYDPYAVIRPAYAWGPGAWGLRFAMGVAGAWAWHHIRWGHGLTITPHPYYNFTNNGQINVGIGGGNRWRPSNRPGKRPSQLPSNSRPRPPQNRPGGGRPGSGGVRPRPEQPINRPGGRPGDRPGTGERPTRPNQPPARPGAGERPTQPNQPPARPGAGERPTRPNQPPARPAAGTRPSQPSRPTTRPAPSRTPGDRSAMSGAANNGRSTQNASSRGRASAAASSRGGTRGGGGGRQR